MDANEYQELAARTLIDRPGFEISDRDIMAVWDAIGLAGEAGEVADHIKKGVFHQHGLDIPKLEQELGDTLWYVAALCTTLGLDLSAIMQANIDKLKIRYPNGYSSVDSLHRADVNSVTRSLALVTLVVREYDEAIAFFTDALRFIVVQDTPLGGVGTGAGKRWVVVAPPESRGAALLLARAATPEQLARVGQQTGGRVAFFLHTSDFWDDYRHMQSRGVRFVEEPREESYGRVVVFLDLYGNKWDLVQPNDAQETTTV